MDTEKLSSAKPLQVIIGILFLVITFWWILLFKDGNQNPDHNLTWAASYQLLALFGAVGGFFISKYFGGFKSLLGQAIIFFALGLLFQVFGQSVFSYYNIVLQVEIPYPSIADIGFFGSIPLYIYGGVLLTKALGGRVLLKSSGKKLFALLIPAGMLVASYFFFLAKYEFDWSAPLQIFLDFGYPLGQAIYISIAIVTYILSQRLLGGMMKASVLIILIGLFVQYVADYNFLYQTLHGTWINGGYGDFIYTIAYFVMAIGLVNFGNVIYKMKSVKA